MKNIILFLALVLLLSGGDNTIAQEPTKEGDNIIELLRTANTKELAKLFSASVQLTLPVSEGRFNRTQAELIMKDFFIKYPPQSAALNHRGTSNDGSSYLIGDYVSGKTKYRTYFLLRKVGSTPLIHQLRIETDE